MYTRKHLSANLVLAAGLFIGGVLNATDEPMLGEKGISFSPVSTHPVSATSSDPSQSGISGESVNLYTGQHTESLVLGQMTGRGGITASLILNYGGNVSSVAKAQNHGAQASPFGLGFTLERETIVCDHKNTVNLKDDEYTLISGNTSTKLIRAEGDRFVTENGMPWVIHRYTESIYDWGGHMVIGWEIIREDGTVYKYGDFSEYESQFNATHNCFEICSYVGNDVKGGRHVYPDAWDLRWVRDPEQLNGVEYKYLQERDRLYFGPNATDPYSERHYTRASYIDEICFSDGGRIDIDYEPRTDFQPYYGRNLLEYYSTYRACRVSTITAEGDTLSVTELEYDYLRHNEEEFDKLLLKRIVARSPGTIPQRLPSMRFEYFAEVSDLQYGAIKSITYPGGAVKEMHYARLDESENLSNLDHVIDDNLGGFNRQFVSKNVVLNVEDGAGNSSVTFWDGIWHTQTLDDVNLNSSDIQGVTPDDWAVVFERDARQFLIYRWDQGGLECDTLANTAQLTEDVFDVCDRFQIFAGENRFVMVASDLDPNEGPDVYEVRSIYYYLWDGQQWVDWRIFYSIDNWLLYSAKLSGDIYGISVVRADGADWRMCFGKCTGAEMIKDSWTCNDHAIGSAFVLGVNYVAWRYNVYVKVADFLPVSKVWRVTQPVFDDAYENHPEIGLNGRTIRKITRFHNSNGFAVSYDMGGSGDWAYITLFFPYPGAMSVSGTPGITRPHSLSTTENFGLEELRGSDHYLVGQLWDEDGDNRAHLYRFDWGGAGLSLVKIEDNASVFCTAEQFRDAYAWGMDHSRNSPDQSALAWQYLGDQQWSNKLLDTPGLWRWGFSSTDRYLIGNTGGANELWLYEPFYSGVDSTYKSYTVNEYSSTCDYDDNWGYFFAADDIFCVKSDDCVSDATLMAYKLCDTLFKGKAPIVVVDHVTMSTFVGDPDPRIIKYSFYQGMLDKEAQTPRFCKAEVSTPYFASEGGPEGWSVTYFYNDLGSFEGDRYAIADDHISETVYTPPLAPIDTIAYPYGRLNGGHWLDGLPFLHYEYSSDGGLTETINSQKLFYRLMKTPDSALVDDVYRIVVHSDTSISDGIQSVTEYTYDVYNRQVKARRTKTQKGWAYQVETEETCYAYDDPSDVATADAMKAGNAIVQVLSKTVEWDNYGVKKTLGRQGQRYNRHGSWVPVEAFTWRDFDNLDDTLFTSKAVSFDDLGNVTSTLNVEGIASAIKYDSSSSRPVASAVNCAYDALIVQDFEQGTDWEGWSNWLLGTYHNFDEDAFTGSHSFVLTDNPASDDHNWSPYKEVSFAVFEGTQLYFSAWAKANHILKVVCFILDGEGTECASRTLEFSDLSAVEWQKIEGVFDFSGIGATCVTGDLQFRWFLVDEPSNPAPAGAFVMMDDIRLHPLKAHIATTVYDKSTGLVTATLGSNNIPARFEYDEFHRLAATRNYRGELLSRSEVEFSRSEGNAEVFAAAGTEQKYDSVTFIADFEQKVKYTWFLWSMDVVGEVNIQARIRVNDNYELDFHGDVAPGGPVQDQVIDSFSVLPGDTITIVAVDSSFDGDQYTTIECEHLEYGGFNAADPHMTTAVAYASGKNGFDSTVSVSFYNGLGEVLQTRSTSYLSNGSEAAVVSGVKVKDGRGRIVKSYKPYADVVAPGGVLDYTPQDEVDVEIDTYYDGSNDVDCDGFAFSEMGYYPDIRGLVCSTSAPGYDWRIEGNHITTVEYRRDPANYRFSTVIYDPDGIKSVAARDAWNRFNSDSSFYTNSRGDDTVVVRITYLNGWGTIDSAAITDGVDAYVLRKMYYSDLGFVDSAWSVDLGTVHCKYNRAGIVRFVQNKKHEEEGIFVYYKYDEFGRKIEEGTVGQWFGEENLFSQSRADDNVFPFDGLPDLNVRYTWTYDKAEDRVNYGALMHTGMPDGSYYREYFYFPFEYKDSVVTRLMIANGDLKSVVHEFDSISAQAVGVTVYPYESTEGARSVGYGYDLAGRLKFVEERAPDGSPLGHTRKFAEYDYYLGNQIKRKLLGVFNDGGEADTVQILNYAYNPLGMLTAINDPLTVEPYPGGIGEDHPHFGMTLDYTAGGTGYYNGRVAAMKTSNSTDYGLYLLENEYTFNQLGWLTEVDASLRMAKTAHDRTFWYNFLGNRDSVNFGGTITGYDYDLTPGSSKLLGFNGANQSRFYDDVGNMVQDDEKWVHELSYDYRNMICGALVHQSDIEHEPEQLTFAYDQSGRRIYKKFLYSYLAPCEDSRTVLPSMIRNSDQLAVDNVIVKPHEPGGGGGGSNVTNCDFWTSIESHYLYDGSALVMTFDQDDSVMEYFVQDKGGNVAVYEENDDDLRAYIITDQVGSTRLMLGDEGGVKFYAFYHPFGGKMSESVTYDYPFKFTGKERDEHATFDYYYFGARYYEPEVGRFTSLDKAGQFASGYIYGSDPVLGVDRDGNELLSMATLVTAAEIIGTIVAVRAAKYSFEAAHEKRWNWRDFWASIKQGFVEGVEAAISANISDFLFGSESPDPTANSGAGQSAGEAQSAGAAQPADDPRYVTHEVGGVGSGGSSYGRTYSYEGSGTSTTAHMALTYPGPGEPLSWFNPRVKETMISYYWGVGGGIALNRWNFGAGAGGKGLSVPFANCRLCGPKGYGGRALLGVNVGYAVPGLAVEGDVGILWTNNGRFEVGLKTFDVTSSLAATTGGVWGGLFGNSNWADALANSSFARAMSKSWNWCKGNSWRFNPYYSYYSFSNLMPPPPRSR